MHGGVVGRVGGERALERRHVAVPLGLVAGGGLATRQHRLQVRPVDGQLVLRGPRRMGAILSCYDSEKEKLKDLKTFSVSAGYRSMVYEGAMALCASRKR